MFCVRSVNISEYVSNDSAPLVMNMQIDTKLIVDACFYPVGLVLCNGLLIVRLVGRFNHIFAACLG
jgi:hypothetical protein